MIFKVSQGMHYLAAEVSLALQVSELLYLVLCTPPTYLTVCTK